VGVVLTNHSYPTRPQPPQLRTAPASSVSSSRLVRQCLRSIRMSIRYGAKNTSDITHCNTTVSQLCVITTEPYLWSSVDTAGTWDFGQWLQPGYSQPPATPVPQINNLPWRRVDSASDDPSHQQITGKSPTTHPTNNQSQARGLGPTVEGDYHGPGTLYYEQIDPSNTYYLTTRWFSEIDYFSRLLCAH
jgi:hypothetical protein